MKGSKAWLKRGELALVAGAAMLVGTGCFGGGKYVTVRTELHYGEREQTQPEVLRARTSKSIEAPSRIAVQWPSYCANMTSAEAMGDALPQGNISSIDCAVEMAELERAFARAGFQVVLWDAVRRYAALNKVTPEAAAEKLGVPLLLRVNSFEKSAALPGADARWQREYYQSNAGGGIGPSLTVHPRIADQLDALASEIEENIQRAPRLAVTLDVSVETIPSGEITWFYRWTHSDDQNSSVSQRFLVLCANNICNVRIPKIEDTAVPQQGPRSGSTRAISVQGHGAMPEAVIYAKLAREVLDDLVRQFQQGIGGGSPQAAAAEARRPSRPQAAPRRSQPPPSAGPTFGGP